MKIGWGLITNRDALWTNVIRGKYRCGNDLMPIINKRRQGSRLWSGIKEIWDTFNDGIEIVQRNTTVVARWKYEKSGVFTTKSAYNLLTQVEDPDDIVWSKLWKVKAPERCKMHVWLMLQGSLITNGFKRDRRLHVTGNCDNCIGDTESILHVSRDCPLARGIWLELGVSIYVQDFWNFDLVTWLKKNICNTTSIANSNWNVLFCITCWLLWIRRNERTHQGTTSSIVEALAEIHGVVRCMPSLFNLTGSHLLLLALVWIHL